MKSMKLQSVWPVTHLTFISGCHLLLSDVYMMISDTYDLPSESQRHSHLRMNLRVLTFWISFHRSVRFSTVASRWLPDLEAITKSNCCSYIFLLSVSGPLINSIIEDYHHINLSCGCCLEKSIVAEIRSDLFCSGLPARHCWVCLFSSCCCLQPESVSTFFSPVFSPGQTPEDGKFSQFGSSVWSFVYFAAMTERAVKDINQWWLGQVG